MPEPEVEPDPVELGELGNELEEPVERLVSVSMLVPVLPVPLEPLAEPPVPEPPEEESVSDEVPLVPLDCISCCCRFFAGFCVPDVVLPLLISLPAAGLVVLVLSLWANATLAAPIMDTRTASRKFFMVSPCKKNYRFNKR